MVSDQNSRNVTKTGAIEMDHLAKVPAAKPDLNSIHGFHIVAIEC